MFTLSKILGGVNIAIRATEPKGFTRQYAWL